ncbi:right-handed parallel beta-helix repeat-containing protein, partial [Planctomycetota bacterium]
LRPSQIGHVDVQANFITTDHNLIERRGAITKIHNEMIKSPSNVVVHAAKNITFKGCTFTKFGSGGIDIEAGSQNNLIQGCHFYDIAGNGIQVGDVLTEDHHPKDNRSIVKDNHVINNLIEDCANEYHDGIGIFVGYTQGTRIANNEIRNLPYTGISLGWGWGEEELGSWPDRYYQPFYYDTPSITRDNIVENNHLYNVMTIMHDGGAIYVLGDQPGSSVRGNHVHDNNGSPGGIYLDEGCGFVDVYNNLIYNIRDRRRPVKHHNAWPTCTIYNNISFMPPGSGRTPMEQNAINQIAQNAGLQPQHKYLLKK